MSECLLRKMKTFDEQTSTVSQYRVTTFVSMILVNVWQKHSALKLIFLLLVSGMIGNFREDYVTPEAVIMDVCFCFFGLVVIKRLYTQTDPFLVVKHIKKPNDLYLRLISCVLLFVYVNRMVDLFDKKITNNLYNHVLLTFCYTFSLSNVIFIYYNLANNLSLENLLTSSILVKTTVMSILALSVDETLFDTGIDIRNLFVASCALKYTTVLQIFSFQCNAKLENFLFLFSCIILLFTIMNDFLNKLMPSPASLLPKTYFCPVFIFLENTQLKLLF